MNPDPCKHCRYRGSLQLCQSHYCANHQSWYAIEIVTIFNNLLEKLNKAEESLTLAGFEDKGGKLWKPPVNTKVIELHKQLEDERALFNSQYYDAITHINDLVNKLNTCKKVMGEECQYLLNTCMRDSIND